jgi:hypothetical protein
MEQPFSGVETRNEGFSNDVGEEKTPRKKITPLNKFGANDLRLSIGMGIRTAGLGMDD